MLAANTAHFARLLKESNYPGIKKYERVSGDLECLSSVAKLPYDIASPI
jgi:hypothetical protein